MSLIYKKLFQKITFLLVISLANGFVFAVPPNQNLPAKAVNKKTLPSGILHPSGEKSVSINGNAAFDGMTVFSGTNIKTGKKSGAVINLRQIGRVELCSETSAKLVFTAEQIDLQLLSGKAKLTTLKNINGSMTGSDGKTQNTDPKLETSSTGDCDMDDDVVIAAAPAAAPATGLFGMGLWSSVAIFGGIVGGSALVWFADEIGSREGTVSGVQP